MYRNVANVNARKQLETDPNPATPNGAAPLGEAGPRTVRGAVVMMALPLVVVGMLASPLAVATVVGVVMAVVQYARRRRPPDYPDRSRESSPTEPPELRAGG